MMLGNDDGLLLGISDGTADGAVLGYFDIEGDNDGFIEGDDVGILLGNMLGIKDGFSLGLSDGKADGVVLGTLDIDGD